MTTAVAAASLSQDKGRGLDRLFLDMETTWSDDFSVQKLMPNSVHTRRAL